jgi:hypothetical protein
MLSVNPHQNSQSIDTKLSGTSPGEGKKYLIMLLVSIIGSFEIQVG